MNPRRAALSVLCLLAIVPASVLLRVDRPPGSSARAVAAPDRTATEALAVLGAWDRRRAEAWRRGDARALAGLYTDGSRSGDHDRAMLEAYVDRGLRVQNLRMQVFGVSVRVWAADRVVLEVTDRVVGATAVGPGVRIGLPRDEPSSRVVSLRRVAGEWLVEEVRDQPGPSPSPEASTASTSRSRNS